LRISDVDEKNVTTETLDGIVDYTLASHAISSDVGGGLKFDGCQSEIVIIDDTYYDLDVESNRRLFTDTENRPVDLGSIGTNALFYSKAGNEINDGTGGNLVMTGSPPACSSGP
jgi:hypothetical protein